MSPTETAPLIGGDVIAHSKRPHSYCLLFSFEGRLKNLLCHLIFQWNGSTIELHCARVCAACVLGIHSNTAYQSPRGTEPADCVQRFVGNIQQLPSSRYSACLFVYLFIYSLISLPSFQCNASMFLSQPACGLSCSW